jgi:hypothetical protein
VLIAYFKGLFLDLLGETEENKVIQGNWSSSQDSNRLHPEYDAGVLTTLSD